MSRVRREGTGGSKGTDKTKTRAGSRPKRRRRLRPRAYVLLALVAAGSVCLGLVLSGYIPGGGRDAPTLGSHVERRTTSSRLPSDDFSALLQRAVAQYDKKHYRTALPLYQKALELEPESAIALVDAGVCYFELGSSRLALEYFDRALKLDPRSRAALFNKGYLLSREGRATEAKFALRAYLRTRPSASDATRARNILSELE